MYAGGSSKNSFSLCSNALSSPLLWSAWACGGRQGCNVGGSGEGGGPSRGEEVLP